jgi:hypothetical protein
MQIIEGAAETRDFAELAVTEGYETNLSPPYTFNVGIDMR